MKKIFFLNKKKYFYSRAGQDGWSDEDTQDKQTILGGLYVEPKYTCANYFYHIFVTSIWSENSVQNDFAYPLKIFRIWK